ncbi:hypothetical protein Droror1_Dr00019914, partial [Drosera rotundifolia]
MKEACLAGVLFTYAQAETILGFSIQLLACSREPLVGNLVTASARNEAWSRAAVIAMNCFPVVVIYCFFAVDERCSSIRRAECRGSVERKELFDSE